MGSDGAPRHTFWTVFVLLLALVATVAGYLVGSRVRSPQEVAASANPPPTSEVFAVVRHGSVETSARFNGVVTWHREFDAEKVAAGSAVRPIVTRLPLAKNVSFDAGTVLLEVADRPVIALQGEIPMLRDLRPGAHGADVIRLQQALADAGHYRGAIDGTFGALTGQALRSLYESAGYPAPTRATRAQADQGGDPVALAAELTFVPSLPATLLGYPAALGDEVKAVAATVGTGGLQVAVEVTADWLPAVKRPGSKITIDGAGPRPLRAQVLEVGRPRLVDGERMVRVTLRPGSRRLPAASVDTDVQIQIRQRNGPAGLKIPLSALFASATSGDFVRARRAEGSTVVVPVRVHATGNGAAIVAAREPDALKVGDRVVVGTRAP